MRCPAACIAPRHGCRFVLESAVVGSAVCSALEVRMEFDAREAYFFVCHEDLLSVCLELLDLRTTDQLLDAITTVRAEHQVGHQDDDGPEGKEESGPNVGFSHGRWNSNVMGLDRKPFIRMPVITSPS